MLDALRNVNKRSTDEFEREVLATIVPYYDTALKVWFYPASAVTKSGTQLPRVVFIRRSDALRTLCSLEWLEANDPWWRGEVEVNCDDIASVSRSGHQLSAKIVKDITRPSVDASYLLQTKNGKGILFRGWRGQIGQSSFLKLLDGFRPDDIKSVRWDTSIKPYSMPRSELPDYGCVKLCLYPSASDARLQPMRLTSELSDGCDKPPHIVGDKRTEQIFIREYSDISWNGSDLIIDSNKRFEDEQLSVDERDHDDAVFERVLVKSGILPPAPLTETASQGLRSLKSYRTDMDRLCVPASATLRDGTVLPRILLVNEGYAKLYGYSWRYFVKPNDITAVEESKYTIPKWLDKKMQDIETSMDSTEFLLHLRDGSVHACWYSFSNHHFLELPPSHSLDDIVDVTFGRHARYQRAILVEPDYVVSVIQDER